MRYQALIGCEVHVQVLTVSKAFCTCSNTSGRLPNTQVCPICLGLPGVLPMLNVELIHQAVKTARMLSSEIQPLVRFARKHYFYPDLPKGYQITQLDPIGKGGFLRFMLPSGDERCVRLIRVHMEEDTGKSLHWDELGESYLDYNRCGAPLLEIVSQPDMHTPEEVTAYLQTLRENLRHLGISDGQMEQGSLRCDVNVNLLIEEEGKHHATPLVEVKNMNSFRAIEEALVYEIDRQYKAFLEDRLTKEQKAKQTRGFDERQKTTYLLRQKESIEDYRYFVEPDIPPILLTEEQIHDWSAEVGELPVDIRARLKRDYHFSDFDVETLTARPELLAYFESALPLVDDPKRLVNWILVEVLGLLHKEEKTLAEFTIPATDIARLVNAVGRGEINGTMAKQFFLELSSGTSNLDELFSRHSEGFISDEIEIRHLIEQLLLENEPSVRDYRSGKTNAFKYLMGQLMKKTQGRLAADLAQRMMREILES